MKVALIIGEFGEALNDLIAELKVKGISSIKTVSVDEIDQVGQQQGKAVLLFAGTKIPYAFLTENRWSFPTKSVLYLPSVPNLNEETKKRIKDVRLELVAASAKTKLASDIDQFLSSTYVVGEEPAEEILFAVHEAIKKEKK